RKAEYRKTVNVENEWMKRSVYQVDLLRRDLPRMSTREAMLESGRLIRLIRSMLQWEPHQRPTMSDVLQSAYFRGMTDDVHSRRPLKNPGTVVRLAFLAVSPNKKTDPPHKMLTRARTLAILRQMTTLKKNGEMSAVKPRVLTKKYVNISAKENIFHTR